MFCGAAVFAYLAVARLAYSRWIGLAAALIAFSSYSALYYSDQIANESAMDIFGVMLTFHGMVVFVQDGRFRQLIIKACAALLVGWHVYALLLAFIVFGLAGEIVAWLRGRQACSNSPTVWNIHNNLGVGWILYISFLRAYPEPVRDSWRGDAGVRNRRTWSEPRQRVLRTRRRGVSH